MVAISARISDHAEIPEFLAGEIIESRHCPAIARCMRTYFA